jgi:hypothetical protein
MFSSIYYIFRANSSIREVYSLILIVYFMEIIVYPESLTSAYPAMKKMLGANSPSIFLFDILARSLIDIGANYYPKSNVHSYFALQNRTPYQQSEPAFFELNSGHLVRLDGFLKFLHKLLADINVLVGQA